MRWHSGLTCPTSGLDQPQLPDTPHLAVAKLSVGHHELVLKMGYITRLGGAVDLGVVEGTVLGPSSLDRGPHAEGVLVMAGPPHHGQVPLLKAGVLLNSCKTGVVPPRDRDRDAWHRARRRPDAVAGRVRGKDRLAEPGGKGHALTSVTTSATHHTGREEGTSSNVSSRSSETL